MLTLILNFILNLLTFGLYKQYIISGATMHFQVSGSLTFDRLIDFHDFILIYLILILVIVLWALLIAVNISKISLDLSGVSFLTDFISTSTRYMLAIGFDFFKVEKDLEYCKKQYFRSFRPFTSSYYIFRMRRKIHSSLLEIVWTILPSFILILIAIPSLYLLYMLDAAEPLSYAIKVIGHQWYWSYEIGSSSPLFKSLTNLSITSFDSYMLSNETSTYRLLEVDNSLFVPSNIPLTFLITSTDVIHSWAVPSLGIKVDAIPGRLNQVCVTVIDVSQYYGQCSELCGVNHGFMPISIISLVDKIKI